MANVFDAMPAPQNPLVGAVQRARQVMGGNPQAAYQQMMQTNPQFRNFMEQNKGKTPGQVASEMGVDLGAVGRLLGM